jgi:hypothetical protein
LSSFFLLLIAVVAVEAVEAVEAVVVGVSFHCVALDCLLERMANK